MRLCQKNPRTITANEGFGLRGVLFRLAKLSVGIKLIAPNRGVHRPSVAVDTPRAVSGTASGGIIATAPLLRRCWRRKHVATQ